MFGEAAGLPIAGNALVTLVLYAGVSLFVTGPTIGERLAAKMNWAAQCARFIEDEARAKDPPPTVMPTVNCENVFGTIFGQEGQRFCFVHGDTINNNPITDMVNQSGEAERKAQEQRMDWAVSRANSRCECAVTTALEEDRIDLAIHAGSARLITPHSVRALESDLIAALNTPACAMKG